jgi:hypothetical protein
MSRSEQGKTLAIASLAFSGAAAGTSFSTGGMTLTVGIAMAVGLCVALFGFVYARKSEDQAETQRKQEESDKEERQRQEREKERQERADAEAKNHEIFMNGRVPCEFPCGIKFQRKKLWRLPDELRDTQRTGAKVCRGCFVMLMGRGPKPGQDKPAFE